MVTIFTQIIQKKIPSYILYEDELVISFLDIAQFTKGHTLVVPKQEYTTINDIPLDIFIHLSNIVYKMSQVLTKALQPLGMKALNILNNNGVIAGQTVLHYHFHLIPRFYQDEISWQIKNSNTKLKTQDYLNLQKKILFHM